MSRYDYKHKRNSGVT